MEKNYGFETIQVHGGYDHDTQTGAHVTPIYQTNAYVFEDPQDAADQFMLRKPGSIYTRLGNPTVNVLEERIAQLEGGVGALCFASGMAAIMAAITNIAESGSEIVVLSAVYGGTYTLLFQRFEYQYGIKVRSVDPEDLAGLEAAINDNTRCVYFETIGNPNTNIPDLEAVIKIAHNNGLPTIVDNTFGTPYLIDCKALGVDITVHSLTKFIGGHGNSVGGSVTDLGNFDFKGNPRFAMMNNPDEAYQGIVYADLGPAGYLTKLRAGILRDTGACLSPLNAFLLLQGLETLSLRMEKHTANAVAVAQFLNGHPAVTWINYPGLPGDKFYGRAQKYFKKGVGSIFAFGIKGGVEAGKRFISALELFSFVANVSDVRSLITHPASMTHSQLDDEGLKAAGVSGDLIRISVGIETVEDLIADLDQALKVSQA